MKTQSQTILRRLLPVNVVAGSLIALGIAVQPGLTLGQSAAASHTASVGAAKDPDAGASAQGAASARIGEGPVHSWQEEQYRIRAYPNPQIPESGYTTAEVHYNLMNDFTFPGGWQEVGPAYTPNANFFVFSQYNNVKRTSVSGRATAMVAVPSTCKNSTCGTIYLGTASGGVWKTIDGGAHWVQIFDHNPQIAVSSVTLDPVNPQIVYVGTGENNNCGGCQRGVGIFRSANGGQTWTQLGFDEFANRAVSKIIVDPRVGKGAGTTHATLYAITASALVGCQLTYSECNYPPYLPTRGFYYSTDGGSTWTVSNPPEVAAFGGYRAFDLVMDPSNPNILYVAFGLFGIYRSMNDGMTSSSWVRLPNQPAQYTFYRVQMDFAASTANSATQILYAAYNDTYNPSAQPQPQRDCDVRQPGCSTNGGETLYQIKITNKAAPDGGAVYTALPNPQICGAIGADQCAYDMPIRVDPTNANILYNGGNANYDYYFNPAGSGPCATLYPLAPNCHAVIAKSTDGGQTWRDISLDASKTSIHPDDHFIYLSPTDPSVLWDMNDGGVYQATQANTLNTMGGGGQIPVWYDKNPGISTLQFVGIGVGPTNLVWGGTQDNGTFLTPTGPRATGKHILLGDGGQGVADPFDPTVGYGEQYGATMFRFNKPTCDFQPGPYDEGYPACGSTWIAAFSNDFDLYGGGGFYQPQVTGWYNPDGTHASNNVFHGTYRVWRSTNYGGKDLNHDGDITNDPNEQTKNPSDWVPISPDLACTSAGTATPDQGPTPAYCFGSDSIENIAVAPYDPNTVVATTNNGRVWVTHNALAPVTTNQGVNYCPLDQSDPAEGAHTHSSSDCVYEGGPTWKEIDQNLPAAVATSVAFAPKWAQGRDAQGNLVYNTYYAVMSGFGTNHVYVTTDDGTNWTALDNSNYGPQYSLPDLPFNSIAVNQRNGHLYVAADIGVFYSQNTGLPNSGHGIQWLRNDQSLPNTVVYQLTLNPSQSTLYAAVYGRGIWSAGAQ